MTAARSTMSDTMHLRRTIGQLGRIALHSSRNARSAPVSPTDVHVCHMVRSKIASTSMVKSPDLSSGHENLLDAIMTLSDHDLHLPWIHHWRRPNVTPDRRVDNVTDFSDTSNTLSMG